jgi:hypothetical protein
MKVYVTLHLLCYYMPTVTANTLTKRFGASLQPDPTVVSLPRRYYASAWTSGISHPRSLALVDNLMLRERPGKSNTEYMSVHFTRHSFNDYVTMYNETCEMVLTNTINQNLSDYAGPDVSPVNNAVAPATQMTCLQLPTPDALTRLGDSGGHIQRCTSRILRARTYLDLLAFCIPSPPDYMRVISGTGRGGLALFLASHESSFKVPSDCYTMSAYRRVLGVTAERASHVRQCSRCNEAPSESCGEYCPETVHCKTSTSISYNIYTVPSTDVVY